MIVELLLSGASYYLLEKLDNRDFKKFKTEFDLVIERIPAFKNTKNEMPLLLNYVPQEYGYKATFILPIGVTSDTLQCNYKALKEALKVSSIRFESNDRVINLHAIKDYNFKQFKSYKLKPNEILVAEFLGKNIVVDMNKYPHALICGDTGTGKSRILFTILTNLISNSNKISLYLLQVRKNDLVVFRNCKQVKCCSRTLEEVLEALQEIDKELQRRESLLDIEKGYLNIADYNKLSGKTLKYIYCVIEEFSFLNISKADSKEEKFLKASAMKIIKSIVNVGRSSGVFLLTSLQKPTSDSIPTDIKAQLTTRIALTIKDKSTCQVVMGDDSAVNLELREIVCRTNDLTKGYSLTIDFPEIKEFTQNSIVVKEQKSKPPAKEKIKKTADDLLKALGI